MMVVVKPLRTEKTDRLRKLKKYVFIVDIKATKPQIKREIEKVYNVKIEKVNTIIVRGKVRRRRYGYVKEPNFKKAIVTLKSGEIEV